MFINGTDYLALLKNDSPSYRSDRRREILGSLTPEDRDILTREATDELKQHAVVHGYDIVEKAVDFQVRNEGHLGEIADDLETSLKFAVQELGRELSRKNSAREEVRRARSSKEKQGRE